MEFNSLSDLYIRVTPALKIRVNDFMKMGISDICEKDIFNFLSIIKWKSSVDLSLAEIVNDILNCDINSFKKFKFGGVI